MTVNEADDKQMPTPLPWFVREEPLYNGKAVIERGTYEDNYVAECEWHNAAFIIECVNNYERVCLDNAALVEILQEFLDRFIEGIKAENRQTISYEDRMILEARDALKRNAGGK